MNAFLSPTLHSTYLASHQILALALTALQLTSLHVNGHQRVSLQNGLKLSTFKNHLQLDLQKSRQPAKFHLSESLFPGSTKLHTPAPAIHRTAYSAYRAITKSLILSLDHHNSQCGMGRTFTFRVPRRIPKRPQALVTSDRASTLPLLFEIRNEGLSVPEAPSPNVYRVLEKFKKPLSLLLYIPEKLEPNPFTYYTTENAADPTIVAFPRLLVTKLLSYAWCELELFYRIYSGLQKKEVTTRLAEGSEYHDRLENEEHERADMSSAVDQLTEIAAQHSPEKAIYLGRNQGLAEWAKSVTEHSIKRGISLAQTRHAREIDVHSFIDFETNRPVERVEDLHKGVLVRGIADIVQFERKSGTEKKNDIHPVEFPEATAEIDKISLMTPIWDLNRAIPELKEEVQISRDDYFLQVRDVKTRGVKSLPKQELQLKAAKDQCMYYTRFFLGFTKDIRFTYESYQESARRREIDIDAEIGEAHAVILLLEKFEALALDYVRLAQGQPLGFAPHDEIMSEIYENQGEGNEDYDLSKFISEKEFKEILENIYGDTLAVKSIEISVLFKPWKYPLTPRYFIARVSQVYDIFNGYDASTVAVDYHHSKLGTIIGSKVYPYTVKANNEALKEAVNFWTGRRPPREADSRWKCNNCEFNSRCPAINKPFKQSIGALIYHDLLD